MMGPSRKGTKARFRGARAWVRYRRWRLRCDHCGLGFLPVHSVHGYGGKESFHDVCMSARTWRYKAEERLEVLDLVADVWGITMGDATELMANRAERENYERSNAWNKAWRVFYDLDNQRKKGSQPVMPAKNDATR